MEKKENVRRQGDDDDNNEETEAMQIIQNFCQVNETRARELLQAGSGSVDRAVELHYSLMMGERHDDDDGDEKGNNTNAESNQPAALVSEVQAVCNVTTTRARELLEASNGSLERAIDIHFSSSLSAGTAPSSRGTTNLSPTVQASNTVQLDTSNSIPSTPLPETRKIVTSETSKASTARTKTTTMTNKMSPQAGSKRQSTLDAFLGLPTPREKGPKQLKLDSFFGNTIKGSCTAVSLEKDEDGRTVSKREDSNLVILEDDEDIKNEEPTRPKAEPKQDTISTEGDVCVSSASVGEYTIVRSELTKQEQNLEATTDACEQVEQIGPNSEAILSSTNSTNLATTIDNPSTSDNPKERLAYSILASRFSDMISTTKRNAKLQCLNDIFKDVIDHLGGIHMESSRENDAYLLTCTIDLILGKLSVTKNGVPKENITLQVSGAAVSMAVQTVTGVSRAQMRETYRSTGDLGDVACKYFLANSVKSFFKSPALSKDQSISEVHDLLQRVATVSPGKGSQAARQNLLVKLLRGCKDKNEMRFLVRTLLGNMRLGATLKSVISALATATCHFKEEPSIDAGQALQDVFNICPKILDISKALLEGGVSRATQVCTLVVGHPIQPMLANPAHSLEEVKKFMDQESAVAEWKYDGVRCQAHYDGKIVILYSRHLLNNTAQYPDAVEYFLDAKVTGVNSFICDAEIVGVTPNADAKDGFQLLPFQDLSRRRTTKIDAKGEKVTIRIYCYDLMYLNGTSLLKEPLWKRQELLQKSFVRTDGFGFAFSERLDFFNQELLQGYLKASVEGGAEGLMIKLTDKTYESGARSRFWLKLKRDYVSGSADTIDVVPIGAWFGNGRKAQAGFLSPVLLAVYDEEEGVFRSISRCMSFTDDMYRATRQFYFHGTPYPAGVGISPDENGEGNEGQAAAENIDDSFYSDAVGDDSSSAVGVENRVNCFPFRPPSSVYITNENPSVWFKPMGMYRTNLQHLT